MEKELNYAKYGLSQISKDQLKNCYFHPNWDTTNDQNDPFQSALSSIVSSPIASSSNGGGDGVMIRELIGRLGSICDDHSGGETTLSPPNASTNTSSYSTPLNSPPSKFNLYNNNVNSTNFAKNPIQKKSGSFNFDPKFGGNARNFAEIGCANSKNEVVVRSIARLENGGLNLEKKVGENGDSRESSSVSEQNPGVENGVKPLNGDNLKKRKSVSKAKVKHSSPLNKDDKVDVKKEELIKAKRSKIEEEEEEEKESNAEEASKAEEAPKDYIHVRARRGQATDTHSLAERVRREKISERMKFLQDLVPGCNKVTGKATILDEIINYVQSLQRQVEFLSMKLATVNPRMEFNMEALLSKDMFQSRGTLPQTMYPTDQNSLQAFPFSYQSTQQMSLPLPNAVSNGLQNHLSPNPLDATRILRRHPNIPLSSIDGFIDSMTQLPTLWEDDLQSIVQMGIVQNQSQNVVGLVTGTITNAEMKVEL